MKLSLRTLVLGLALTAATVSASTVFIMKKDAERDARAISELDRKISAERQRISELHAEWSALDNPARLQALVDRHADVLRLKPITAEQIASAADIVKAAQRKAEQNEGATQ